MGLKNVFDRMFFKTFDKTMLFKHFMCTVFQTFHDECLKIISSKTFIASAIL